MDIQVKDESQALNICTNAKNQNLKQLNAEIENLEGLINKVKSTWNSSGIDKESYILELEKQINNLRILKDVVYKFFNMVYNYIVNIKSTQNNNMSGPRFTTAELERVINNSPPPTPVPPKGGTMSSEEIERAIKNSPPPTPAPFINGN